MLLLVAAAVPFVPSARAEPQAKVTVRIERAATASRQEWKNTAESGRREVVVRDEHGRPLLLRLIDYQ
jgi:hypothetical protein